MPRPAAITLFDRLYLASIVLYVLNAAIFWSQTSALATEMPQVQDNPAVASMVGGILIGTLVVTVALSVLFWWLVSRQRSEAGKWLVIVTEAIGALTGLWALVTLARGLAPNPTNAAISVVTTALAVAAAAMLLRADAQSWFRDHHAEPLA